MPPHTEFIESAASAFSRTSKTTAGARPAYFYGQVRRPRRAQDRGILWVRITLFLVVSALLLSAVNSSRARAAAYYGPAPQNIPDGR